MAGYEPSAALSILYLRCLYGEADIYYAHEYSFNSLFEMRLVVIAAGCQGGDLSILYLRCPRLERLCARPRCTFAFNSLFEMLLLWYEFRQMTITPLSILYLRCTEPSACPVS